MPGSVLLVAGVAGRSDPLAGERARVLDQLAAALRDAGVGAAVQVRAPGRRERRGRLTPDLGAIGIDPRWSAWAFRGNDSASDGPAGVAATAALLAVGAAGWEGPVDVVETPAVVGDASRAGVGLDAVVTVADGAAGPC